VYGDIDGTVELLNARRMVITVSNGADWSPDGRLITFQSLNSNAKKGLAFRDQSVRIVASEGRNDDRVGHRTRGMWC
jgi:hypothetical protein